MATSIFIGDSFKPGGSLRRPGNGRKQRDGLYAGVPRQVRWTTPDASPEALSQPRQSNQLPGVRRMNICIVTSASLPVCIHLVPGRETSSSQSFGFFASARSSPHLRGGALADPFVVTNILDSVT
jgi:hypothetical protein